MAKLILLPTIQYNPITKYRPQESFPVLLLLVLLNQSEAPLVPVFPLSSPSKSISLAYNNKSEDQELTKVGK